MKVLILSATASAINLIHSFQSIEGVKIFVTDASILASGLYKDGVTPFVIPRARDHKSYQKKLDEIIRENDIDVVIPTSDHDMQGFAQLISSGWRPDARYFEFSPELLNKYVNKRAVIEELFHKGFTVPRVFPFDHEPTEFPVVLKPLFEGGSKGVTIATNKREYETSFSDLSKRFGDSFTIQEYIPGNTGSISVALLLYDQKGQLIEGQTSHSTRTFYSWGGGGTAGEITNDQKLIELAHEMIQALGGWKGPINLEFKTSSKNGLRYLMEINCRLNGYSYLFTMHGINYPKKMLQILNEEELPQFQYLKEIKGNFVLSYREKLINEQVQ